MSASNFKFKVGDILLIRHRVIDAFAEIPNEHAMVIGRDIDKGGPYYTTQDIKSGARYEVSKQYLEHESTELLA